MISSDGARPGFAAYDPRRVPQILQKVITVIYHKVGERHDPVGTGFFLSYNNPTNPQVRYQFLVTARHLIFDDAGERYSAWVRVNRKDQGTELISLGDDKAFVPDDRTVDLAVLPGNYPSLQIDPLYLDADEFTATRNDLQPPGFGIGAEVLYMGLFNPHIGETRNQPITRFGRIALLPDEPVFWANDYVRVILAEINAFGGSSGSPVFIYLGHRDERGLPVPRLLGVLKGSFTQKHPATLVEIDATVLVMNVVGIAAIVPAFVLDDFIRQQVIPALEREAEEESDT